MADTAEPVAVALDDATVAFRVAGDRVYTAVERANLSVAHGGFVAIVDAKRRRARSNAQRGRAQRWRSSHRVMIPLARWGKFLRSCARLDDVGSDAALHTSYTDV